MHSASYDPSNRAVDSVELNKKTYIKYITNGFKCPAEKRDVMKNCVYHIKGQAETSLVEALSYRPGDRGLDSR
jgi:hypothetical protein